MYRKRIGMEPTARKRNIITNKVNEGKCIEMDRKLIGAHFYSAVMSVLFHNSVPGAHFYSQ